VTLVLIAIGGVIAVAGEILGDFGEALGIVEPDCDGIVFDTLDTGLIMITGRGLMDAFTAGGTNLNQPFPLTTLTDDKQQASDKCGHPPSTTVNFTATITSFQPNVPIFGGTPGSPKSFRPVVGRRRDAWIGNWGDGGSIEGSLVRCSIALPPDILGVGQSLGDPSNAPSVLGPQFLQITIEEHLSDANGPVIFNQSVQTVSGPTPVTEYSGDRPAIVIRHPSHSGDVNPTVGTKTPVALAVEGTPALGLSPTAAAVRFSDSISLDNGGMLQFYVGYDDANQMVGAFVRYINPHSGNFRLTDSDFMLHPVQHIPK
jgi:hypothetical protein